MTKSIWRGKLSTQGRKSEEFEAEIVETESRIALFRRDGLNIKEISPHEVSGEAWMKALVELRGPHKR